MKHLILLLLAIFISSFGFSQTVEGFEITIQLKNFPKDSTAYLGYYFGYDQTVNKSIAKADANGKLVFKGSKPIEQGLYTVSKYKNVPMFDLLIDGQQTFSATSDTGKIAKNIKIVGSIENELFYTHQQEVLEKYEEYKFLKIDYDMKKDIMSKMKVARIQQEIVALQRKFVKDHEGSFAAKIVNAALEPEIIVAPLLPNGKRDSVFIFNYYRNNFLKQIDWSDNRMARTPYVHRKLERYMNDLTIQSNDSLIKAADQLIGLTKNALEVRKFVIYRLTSMYETPKYLNIDSVFLHLAQNYYVNEPMLWDSSSVKKMKKRIKVLTPLQTGKKLPNMLLMNELGQEKNLYDINSKYTVVFVYDPDCVHCKEAMPKLLKLQPALQKRNAAVYAVSTSHNFDRWKAFVRDFKTQSLINVADTKGITDFGNTFDIINTPSIYVLDANKKIIGKHIAVERLDDFMSYIGSKQ